MTRLDISLYPSSDRLPIPDLNAQAPSSFDAHGLTHHDNNAWSTPLEGSLGWTAGSEHAHSEESEPDDGDIWGKAALGDSEQEAVIGFWREVEPFLLAAGYKIELETIMGDLLPYGGVLWVSAKNIQGRSLASDQKVYVRAMRVLSREDEFRRLLAVAGCPVIKPLAELCYPTAVGGGNDPRRFLVLPHLQLNFYSKVMMAPMEDWDRVRSVTISLADVLDLCAQAITGFALIRKADCMHGDIHHANIMCRPDPTQLSGLRYLFIDFEHTRRTSEPDIFKHLRRSSSRRAVETDVNDLADFLCGAIVARNQATIAARMYPLLAVLVIALKSDELPFDDAHSMLLAIYPSLLRRVKENAHIRVPSPLPWWETSLLEWHLRQTVG